MTVDVGITGAALAVAGLTDVGDLVDPRLGRRGGGGDVDLDGPGMRHKDRASRLALRASAPALADAGLLTGGAGRAAGGHLAIPGERVAVVVSSNFGNLDTVCEFADTIHNATVTGLSPMRVPHISSNVTAGWVAIEHGLRGPNVTLCNGTTSGLDAVFWARNLVAVNRVDVAVVVGVEPDTKPVARLHGESGAAAWLDGAAAVIVESGGSARRRGARLRASIGGYARAADPATAATRACRDHPGPIDLCLAADRVRESSLAVRLVPGARSRDLTARLGRCSGALGVLQCAAGATWLDRRGGATVLAVAGGTGDDGEGDPHGAAALVLTRPASDDPEGAAHD